MTNKDKGGRRLPFNRRNQEPTGPVLEKRAGLERRSGLDRRRISDPIVRILGDERRKALRKMDTF